VKMVVMVPPLDHIFSVFRLEHLSCARVRKLTQQTKLAATRGLGWLIPSPAIKETLKNWLQSTRGNKLREINITCVKEI
jgi:hypothetical protein